MRILKQTRAAGFENAGVKHDRHIMLLTIFVQLMQPLVVRGELLVAEIKLQADHPLLMQNLRQLLDVL